MVTRRRYYNIIKTPDELQRLYDTDYWGGVTSDWNGGIFSKDPATILRRYQEYVSTALKVVERSRGKLLEVGCGIGQVVKILRNIGIEVMGLDVSDWAVKHSLTPYTIKGSIYSLPFGDKIFDLVYSHDVLEHIPISGLKCAIAELQRVGKKNYHIISCGSLDDDRDITHVTMHTIRWWKNHVPDDFEVAKKV